ncbi:MAG: SpoIIIAH-like family protein [Clostridia bacterium]|nr:SpoIIIAH-like family protein [Clostridia bacterium]
MNFSSIKQKVREIDWKGVFLSRNFIIVCCVMLVAAGILVFSTAGGKTDTVSQSGTKVLGNAVLVGSEVADGADAEDAGEDSFFAVAVINRQRTRDSAMQTLKEIADSPDTMPDAREEALRSIATLVDEMNAEANIEMLVKSKGFEDCVAIVSDGKCSVIVRSEGLMEDEVAQILTIAVEQSGVSAPGITIIEKK